METSRKSEKGKKQTGDLGDKGIKSHSIRTTKRKENKTNKQKKKTKTGPMRCPSCSGRGRSSHGQADQLPDSSPHSQHVPTLLPGCPRGRSAAHRGCGRRSRRGDLGGCQLNLLLPKWKQSQKRQQERMNLQIQKGKREQREILESKKPTEPSQMTDSYTIFLGRQGVGGDGIRRCCSGALGCGWPLMPCIKITMPRDDH